MAMPFSEDLTKKAQQVAGAAAEKAKDLAGTATEMAKAAIDTAKMNMEILSEQREIEKNYRAIGEWFVSEFQGEVPDAVKDVVAAVNASKEKIAHLEASKKKETAQEAEPVEKSDDAKTCSVCGTVSDSNFCPHCGAPMGK
ncbi:MAG TPA: zinc ribbon domain-containing protein [Oscillibacter sp.]|nr:zinc ribbon domain-containing protein [Oscillibacter sp.]